MPFGSGQTNRLSRKARNTAFHLSSILPLGGLFELKEAHNSAEPLVDTSSYR